MKIFEAKHGNSYMSLTKDTKLDNPEIKTLFQKFQDPKADKLYAVEENLNETKVILHENLEKMLQRGEQLDVLVE